MSERRSASASGRAPRQRRRQRSMPVRSARAALASRRREISILAASASAVIDEAAGALGLDLGELVAIDRERTGIRGCSRRGSAGERRQHGGQHRGRQKREGDPEKHGPICSSAWSKREILLVKPRNRAGLSLRRQRIHRGKATLPEATLP